MENLSSIIAKTALRIFSKEVPGVEFDRGNLKGATILTVEYREPKHATYHITRPDELVGLDVERPELKEIVQELANKCTEMNVTGFAELELPKGAASAFRATEMGTNISLRVIQEHEIETDSNLFAISVAVK